MILICIGWGLIIEIIAFQVEKIKIYDDTTSGNENFRYFENERLWWQVRGNTFSPWHFILDSRGGLKDFLKMKFSKCYVSHGCYVHSNETFPAGASKCKVGHNLKILLSSKIFY